MDILGKSIPGRENSLCKSPQTVSAMFKKMQGGCYGWNRESKRNVGGDGSEMAWGQIVLSLSGHYKLSRSEKKSP